MTIVPSSCLIFFVLYHSSVLVNVCNSLNQMNFLGTLIFDDLEVPMRAAGHPVLKSYSRGEIDTCKQYCKQFGGLRPRIL